jgi:MoxR-like ATPase
MRPLHRAPPAGRMSRVPPIGVQAEAPLLERERELDRIRRSLAAAGAGDGGVLLIEGPAGIGKTTLARAARDQARARSGAAQR